MNFNGVVICVATYKRPEMLKKLLVSLNQQEFPKMGKVELSIVIIDNDSEKSAQYVVREHAISGSANFIYDYEPRRGISYARNKAVKLAQKTKLNLVAFVDDDEYVTHFWLDELLHTMKRYNSDIVIGSVKSEFIEIVPDWIVKGGFFERPSYETGTTLRWGGCGNALFKLDCLTKIEGPFDEEFALIGGEDTLLFETLNRLGVKAVWSNEAVVIELVPTTRANFHWIIKRHFRAGNTFALFQKKFMPLQGKVLRLVKGLAMIGLGIILVIPSIFAGRVYLVRSIGNIARGTGTVLGILGFRVQFYRTTQGS